MGKNPGIPTAASGSCFDVLWAGSPNGSYPGKEFFDGLTDDERAKSLALFNRLARMGRIVNEEKFKKLEGECLWEFKPTSDIRFLGDFRPDRRFFVALGVRKKKRRHWREDLNRAIAILRANDDMLEDEP